MRNVVKVTSQTSHFHNMHVIDFMPANVLQMIFESYVNIRWPKIVRINFCLARRSHGERLIVRRICFLERNISFSSRFGTRKARRSSQTLNYWITFIKLRATRVCLYTQSKDIDKSKSLVRFMFQFWPSRCSMGNNWIEFQGNGLEHWAVTHFFRFCFVLFCLWLMALVSKSFLLKNEDWLFIHRLIAGFAYELQKCHWISSTSNNSRKSAALRNGHSDY